jgi:hypothetical protein
MGTLRTAMLVGMVAGMFGGLGCAAPAPAPVKVQKKYDAVTIFRAVYFDEGAAASLVRSWKLPRKDAVVAKPKQPQPAIAAEQLRDLAKQYDGAKLKLTASNLRHLADTIEKTNAAPRKLSAKQHDATVKLLIGRIRSADKTFFTRFGMNVKSGSHVKVEKILKEGLARITAAASELPKNTTARELDGGGYDDFSGFDDGGGYEGGGYEDTGGFGEGGYDNGGYDNGGYDNGGYDNGGYDNGGYDDGAGGYDQGGADQGGTDTGSGSADQGSDTGGSGADTSGSDTGSSAESGAGGSGDPGSVGDQAALQVNVTVWYDTAVAIDKVAAGYATLFWGATEDGSLQTATFVNHVTTSLE